MSAESKQPKSRVRAWVQNFLDTDDSDLMVQVGENFEYLLDHVREWESGEFTPEDLPNLEASDKWLTYICTSFGTRWPMPNSTLYVVLDTEDRYVGLFGHEENAQDRASIDEDAFTVQAVHPDDVDPQDFVDHFLEDDVENVRRTGETFQYFLDHEEAFMAGDVTPDDFPHFSQNVKWMMAYAIIFGGLWELSHPGLYALLGTDERFHGIYGDPKNAEADAADITEDTFVQRVSVVDGDLPPEDVIGELPGEVMDR